MSKKKKKETKPDHMELEDLEEIEVSAVVTVDDEELELEMTVKEYTTGTIGFTGQTKHPLDETNKLFIQVNAYLIGSKQRRGA